MRNMARFIDANMVEAMIVGSLVLLIFALLRQFRAHPAIAICFAASPLIAIWTHQNYLAGRISFFDF